MSKFSILGIGGIYEDVMLTLPYFPSEDSKLRAMSRKKTRLGGNVPNTFGVLSQILAQEKEHVTYHWSLSFMGALGDSESSVFLKQELETRHIKPCILNRTNCKTPPTAYILESAATHSRTIISHNEVSELTISEILKLYENLYPTNNTDENYPFWVHLDGRNCEALLKVLEIITLPDKFPETARVPRKTISIDFERPGRKGLRELFRFADVALISKDYAKYIATQENTVGDRSLTNVDIVRGFLKNVGNELMKTSVGYITVGSEGCYVLVAQESIHAHAMEPQEIECLESGWLFTHLPASFSGGLVVETTGAGDTFIAAVIYGLGVLNLNPFQAGNLGNAVAGKKCLQEGYDGVWEGVEIPSSQ